VSASFRWRYPLLLAAAIPLAALVIVDSASRFKTASLNWVGGWDNATLFSESLLIVLCGFEMAVALATLIVLSRAISRKGFSPKKRFAAGLTLVAGAVCIGWLLMPLFERLASNHSPQAQATTTTEGKRRLHEIAEEINSINHDRSTTTKLRKYPANEARARILDERYHEFFGVLNNRPNWKRMFAVSSSNDWTEYANWPLNIELGYFGNLLASECRDARLAGKFDEAYQFAETIERLGLLCQYEATLHEANEGARLELLALSEFAAMRDQLPSAISVRVLSFLESTEGQREDLSSIGDKSICLYERGLTSRKRLDNALRGNYLREAVRLQFERRTIDCLKALLKTDLAIRLYRERNGAFPRSLSDLATAFPTEAPIDLYSGKPFVYQASAEDFALYSVGWDGRDDGGNFGVPGQYRASQFRSLAGFDLSLDAFWE
jgi:hypothetical protein